MISHFGFGLGFGLGGGGSVLSASFFDSFFFALFLRRLDFLPRDQLFFHLWERNEDGLRPSYRVLDLFYAEFAYHQLYRISFRLFERGILLNAIIFRRLRVQG